MKIITLLLSMSFSFTVLSQDIVDISQRSSSQIIVRDLKSNQISSKYLSSGESVVGFSTTIIAISSTSGLVKVYDQNFNQVSSKYLSSNERVKTVNGDYVVIKNSSGLVTIYDKKFNQISTRYE